MKTVALLRTPLWAVSLVLIALLAGAFGGGSASHAANDDLVEVFIDARQPAYVIFQGVAESASPQARQEMAGYATLDGISLVAWAQFRASPQDYIAAGIVKNEYPGQNIAEGVLALLKAHPGRPIAITWNGGIATSFFDFQHAVEVYEAYLKDAASYENSRNQSTEDDPLNPEVQIKAMLGS